MCSFIYIKIKYTLANQNFDRNFQKRNLNWNYKSPLKFNNNHNIKTYIVLTIK